MTATDPPPLFARESPFGPGVRRRRWSPQQLVAGAAVVSLLVALIAGSTHFDKIYHGRAVPVQATAISPIALRQLNNGTDAICHATVRVTEPRRVTQRIVVPCGVSQGRPTGGSLYADGTITMDDPLPIWQVLAAAVGVGVFWGFLSVIVLSGLVLVSLRAMRWLEDR
ncbi:MAG: hypothetical protein M3042_08730 [Actinomycetota bacterium]|nr:hypothetical protein [Actinomycetota bacterium]